MALGEVWEGFGEDLGGSWEDFSQFCDAILSILARFRMASNDPAPQNLALLLFQNLQQTILNSISG